MQRTLLAYNSRFAINTVPAICLIPGKPKQAKVEPNGIEQVSLSETEAA